MPFDAVLLGFLFAPARPPIAELTTVHHQHSQLAGATLGQAFGRRFFVALLRLGFGPRSHPLHQGVERRVVNGLRPFAGHLRRLLIRAGGRRRETELLGKPRRQFLMLPQLPGHPHRATPLASAGILSVINDELYLA